MLIPPCPTCLSKAAQWLGASSQESWVNYYRCDICGCVWTVPKDKPDATPHIVVKGKPPAAIA